MAYIDQIDKTRVPKHIAIIMDGNGRWAKARGEKRTMGHIAGVETVRRITKTAKNAGVKFLTLYTFSTENWNRPAEEIEALMGLLLKNLEDEIFMKNDVSFQVIGDLKRLPEAIQKKIQEMIERTSKNSSMCLVLALSYSSKSEIQNAVRQIAEEVKEGKLDANDINEEVIGKHLYTSFMPDPELLIRTGGEIRLSNYLLWQAAYSELYFCDTYWPDFSEDDFFKAIYDYQNRERRFGKTSEQVATE
ncbi:undecaprenyl diphosphate synthase [Bacteroidales bacterium KHT7]|jgi:undecaprenyl diphosphate synthase|uniref:isoprenyl transferase n=1 Tax=unclassified Bacteroides TaxID=2646097 RepID=UPI0004E26E25|nr:MULTISPECIES: isoprenyl transferase [unclassified Bacteroides]MBQ5351871.1 isoprenyl transferase [Bacteroidaceae bacterium]SDG37907.1 undecaprenyl diphosphate synthase [Bacteroidales bacterium KHT7]